jgi:hypothetical protein
MLNIDLFCRVIDNYGDIGVCWRLARQLVAEHGCNVRLIVDDLASFRVIAPEIGTDVPTQRSHGVDVFIWATAESLQPAPVVIEAFACDPPDGYVSAMAMLAKAGQPPVWINLEYLSAEAWVDDVHGRASPHPRLPLTKYFFCPGFTEGSGGLIRESDAVVIGPLSRSVGDVTSLSPGGSGGEGGHTTSQINEDGSFNRPHPPPSPAPREREPTSLFAFAYPQAPVLALAQGFAAANHQLQVTLAAPVTNTSPDWQNAPRVPQPNFDALLAQFDFLIVRGEDSFIRAQWAAKPMLWHIYPTDDDAHLTKLDAWLERYCVGLEPNVAEAYRAASHAFNRGETAPESYTALAQMLPQLTTHAILWRDNLTQQTDLATRLVTFIDLVKSQKVG